VGIVLLTLGVIWWGFLRSEPQKVAPAQGVGGQLKQPEIQIDFETLNSPFLQEVEEFPEIPPFSPSTTGERLGRENPFIPYGTTELATQSQSR
jgi:hypothetical protein